VVAVVFGVGVEVVVKVGFPPPRTAGEAGWGLHELVMTLPCTSVQSRAKLPRMHGETSRQGAPDHLSGLNERQRQAVLHGSDAPARAAALLVIAGAGSGKTLTLANRVAQLVLSGVDRRRILLLTFSRRAAAEMLRRAERILAQVAQKGPHATRRDLRGSLGWAGTFHAVAHRLLRLYARDLGLPPSFTVLDRADSQDLLDLLRHTLGNSRQKKRFPKKGTCLAIYSRAVNAQEPLEETLRVFFPWCAEWRGELRRLFGAYAERKQRDHTLDYDDLLLCWGHLMSEPSLAERVRSRFDQVLVDEYQDTNALQAQILKGLKPDGLGLTVVGDDAQAIYAFRAATVRNILDFPSQFSPPARVVTLEENYRSVPPILAAANAVMDQAKERFTKNLFSQRAGTRKPLLIAAFDESAQAVYVANQALAQREEGLKLKRQAVLFRAAHHSIALELELARRNIPFVKYGGLRFLEAGHVKDLLCLLRWAENPNDAVAAFRTLQLLAGVGPAFAERALAHLRSREGEFESLREVLPPKAALEGLRALTQLMVGLARPGRAWAGQVGEARGFYEPEMQRIYDHAQVRAGDLDALERLADQHDSRERFLAELALDPPEATSAEAGTPLHDEDYLVLSTIHSAKGQEWDSVFVLNVTDGGIPACRSAGSEAEIDEERRLLYVAMTRARDSLHLIQPLRFYPDKQPRNGDRHLYGTRSRFLPDEILPLFDRVSFGGASGGLGEEAPLATPTVRLDVGERLRALWQ
jgi:DNA helicase-2/ATP-dependent DNA helicase PcrA